MLAVLAAVFYAAASARQNTTFYGLSLVLACAFVLGYLVPWLAVRSLSVHTAAGTAEVMEGERALDTLVLHNRSWLPAIAVQVELAWVWAGHQKHTVHAVAFAAARSRTQLAGSIAFPCRGDYTLAAVNVTTGFPLGLHTFRRRSSAAAVHLLVLARPLELGELHVLDRELSSDDGQPSGRAGSSSEFLGLRRYVRGDPVRHIHWMASARAGSLIVRQFAASRSQSLLLVVDFPAPGDAGRPEAAGEAAVRAAAAVSDRAIAQVKGVRVALAAMQEPVLDALAVHRILARMLPQEQSLSSLAGGACAEWRHSEEVVLVTTTRRSAAELIEALDHIAGCGASPSAVLVLPPVQWAASRSIAQAVRDAGYPLSLVSAATKVR